MNNSTAVRRFAVPCAARAPARVFSLPRRAAGAPPAAPAAAPACGSVTRWRLDAAGRLVADRRQPGDDPDVADRPGRGGRPAPWPLRHAA